MVVINDMQDIIAVKRTSEGMGQPINGMTSTGGGLHYCNGCKVYWMSCQMVLEGYALGNDMYMKSELCKTSKV